MTRFVVAKIRTKRCGRFNWLKTKLTVQLTSSNNIMDHFLVDEGVRRILICLMLLSESPRSQSSRLKLFSQLAITVSKEVKEVSVLLSVGSSWFLITESSKIILLSKIHRRLDHTHAPRLCWDPWAPLILSPRHEVQMSTLLKARW
jgi:hypothetical protein